MDALLKKQSQNQLLISNFLTNYNKTGKAKRTKGFISGRIELLNRYFNNFIQTHESLLELGSDASVEDSYFVDDTFSSIECEYSEYLGILKDELDDCTPTSSRVPPPSSTPLQNQNNGQAVSFSMPQINLPQFSGNILEWPSFKDLFTALAINNRNLSNVQRLQYLKTNLSGEAEHLLRDLLITDANFNIAWDSLMKHYENRRILVNTYLSAIMNASKVNRESCSELKLLLSTITQSVRALSNLNRPIEHWDDWLVHVTVHKVDSTTRKDWETSITANDQLPTFKNLTDFMNSRISTLTAIHYDSTQKPISHDNRIHRNQVKSHHSDSNSSTKSSNKCPCCSQKHPLSICFAFRKKSLPDRKAIVVNDNLCINCFSRGHSLNQCASTYNCRVCNQRHHTLLHVGESISGQRVESVPSGPIQLQSVNSNVARNLSCQSVLLATAIVNVQSSNGYIVPLKALLDQGSHASFITQSAVQLLHLRQSKTNVSVQGIGATAAGCARSLVTLNFCSRYNDSEVFNIEALVLNKLTGQLPKRSFQSLELPYLRDIQLADPEYYRSTTIDLILGANVYASLLRDGIHSESSDTVVAQNTALGWILSGPIPVSSPNSVSAHHMCFDFDFDHQLRKFWEVEEVKLPPILNANDQACEAHFIRTQQRNADGRYIVRLPIKPDDNSTDFVDKRKSARYRLLQTEQHFNHDPDEFSALSCRSTVVKRPLTKVWVLPVGDESSCE